MSLFSFISNATITLTLPSAGVVVDPETGNVLPVATTAEYRVYTKVDTDAQIDYEVGVNTFTQAYMGYLADLDPLKQSWPSSVRIGTVASMLFDMDAEPYEVRFTQVNSDFGLTGIASYMPEAVRAKFKLIASRAA